jgi:diguanylate cyclase (GGDEF)-like protein
MLEAAWQLHRGVLEAHLPFRGLEFAQRQADGEIRHYILSGEPVFDAAGAFRGYRGVGREITEHKRVEQTLTRLTHYESLTGLPNRALLGDRLAHAIARADRTGTLLAVMILDLDNFKEINDALGQAVGDQVLTEAARRLQACLRGSDTLARLGDDEFAVLLEGAPDFEEISLVAQRLLGCTFRRASGWRSTRSTTTRRRGCCATPTSRCTTRSARVATTSSASRTTWRRAPSATPSSRSGCGARWNAASSPCITSRWSRSTMAASSAWKRCCAGWTATAWYPRPTSCRSPRKAA